MQKQLNGWARAIVSLWCCMQATGCGSNLDEEAAERVWQALELAQIAHGISLVQPVPERDFSAPVRCVGGGRAVSSLVHTFAFASPESAEPDGSVTGWVTYDLLACRNQRDFSLNGTMRRGFYASQRAPVQLSEQALSAVHRQLDTFYGKVEVQGQLQGTCVVDINRHVNNGRVSYRGSLCGHDAETILQNRPLPEQIAEEPS